MSFKAWSQAVDAPAAKAEVPAGVPAVSVNSFPEGTFDHGWDNVAELLGMGSAWARGMGAQDALGVVLAVLCADVKARDLSKAEMLLWRRKGARGWTMVEARQHAVAKLLMTRPSRWHIWPEIWRMLGLHLELVQNGYWLKEVQTDGTVTGIIPIQPARCRARVSARGNLFYEIYTGTEFERAVLGDTYLIVPADRIIHFRGRMWDGLYGYSNLELGHPIFRLVSAIAQFQQQVFGNDGKQPLVFETDQQFATDEQGNAAFNRLKKQLTAKVQKASVTGEPILLEAGLKAKAIAVNSKDAESKASFDQQVMRVCGLMNCPPHKIYALESVAYNNASAMNRAYYSDCLQPLSNIIEQNLRASLFTEDEMPMHVPQFDAATLMANDLESLTKLVDTCMKSGLMTFDEGREILPFRLDPVPGGDRRMIPVNMAMLDAATGDVIANAAAGQPANQPPSDPAADPEPAEPKAALRLIQGAK